MTDNLELRGPRDSARINVDEPWEVRWWCKSLGVTEEELRKAVQAAGVMVEDVKRYLGR